MAEEDVVPSCLILGVALVITSVLTSASLALAFGGNFGPFLFFVLLAGILIGLPLYVWTARSGPKWWKSAAIGFLAGVFIPALLLWDWEAEGGGLALFCFGALGAMSGVIFQLIVRSLTFRLYRPGWMYRMINWTLWGVVHAAALFLASAAGALLMELRNQETNFLPAIGLPMGFGLVLGVPVYLSLLARKQRIWWWYAPVLGCCIAAFIPALISAVMIAVQPMMWDIYGYLVVQFAVIGATSGLIFAFIIWPCLPPPAGDFYAGTKPEPKKIGWGMIATAVSVLVFAAGWYDYDRKKDLSCETGYNDRHSRQAELRAALISTPAEQAKVEQLFKDFASEKGWLFRSRLQFGSMFEIAACNSAGTTFYAESYEGDGFTLEVHQPKGHPSWRSDFLELYRRLEKGSPGSVYFTGDGGRGMPPPDWLVKEVPEAGERPIRDLEAAPF